MSSSCWTGWNSPRRCTPYSTTLGESSAATLPSSGLSLGLSMRVCDSLSDELLSCVARAVKAAEVKGVDLSDLSLAELQAFSPVIADDVFAALTLEGSVAARKHIGGTAPERVLAEIALAKARLASL